LINKLKLANFIRLHFRINDAEDGLGLVNRCH